MDREAVKRLGKEYVIERFSIHGSFFDLAWNMTSAIQEETLTRDPISTSLQGRLGIIGDEDSEPIVAIMLFVELAKVGEAVSTPDELAGILKGAKVGGVALKEDVVRFLEEKLADGGKELFSARAIGEKRAYARRWTNVISDGEDINRDEFDLEYAQRKKGKDAIKVFDHGAFDSRGVGEVYINRKQVPRGELEPLPYRILVWALLNKGIAGRPPIIAEKCWRMRKENKRTFVRDVQNEWERFISGEILYEELNDAMTVTKSISRASTILRSYLTSPETTLRADDEKNYRISPLPNYVLVGPCDLCEEKE